MDGVNVTEGTALRFVFACRVQGLFTHTGLTSEDLSNMSNLPHSRIEKILEGSFVRLTLLDMDVIARALGMPLYNLLAPAELLAGGAPD